MSLEKILKAGAVIMSSENKNNIALLYRGKQGDWSFPKGHVEPGENSSQTMVREMKEETGLTVQVVQELPNLEYVHSDGSRISTKMFLVVSEDDSKLRLEFEADDIQWIDYKKVVEKLSYDNLKEYFAVIVSILEKVMVSE